MVLVSLPSGAGMVRDDDGSVIVTGDAASGWAGTGVRRDDLFHPVKTWVDEDRSVVGGLLPPGAVSAEAVDDRGGRVPATVGHGAYVALLEQPNDGHEPIVCCRDSGGDPVRRPWAADYPSVRVTDAEVPCPACGATDYDEYTPFERWRGGQRSPNGILLPLPIVSCRACGHEEREGAVIHWGSDDGGEEDDDDDTGAAQVEGARARQRHQQWVTEAATLAEVRFGIYGAQGWPGRLGGCSSQDGQCSEVTIDHYDTPDANLCKGDRVRLAVTTTLGATRPGRGLWEARDRLEGWVGVDEGATRWPDASRAAVTLWLRARNRERRARVLEAVRSEEWLTVDGTLTAALVLRTPDGQWIALTTHAGLAITAAGRSSHRGRSASGRSPTRSQNSSGRNHPASDRRCPTATYGQSPHTCRSALIPRRRWSSFYQRRSVRFRRSSTPIRLALASESDSRTSCRSGALGRLARPTFPWGDPVHRWSRWR